MPKVSPSHPSSTPLTLFVLAIVISIRPCGPAGIVPPVTSLKTDCLHTSVRRLATTLRSAQHVGSGIEKGKSCTKMSHVPAVSVTGSCHSSMAPPEWKRPTELLDEKLLVARTQSWWRGRSWKTLKGVQVARAVGMRVSLGVKFNVSGIDDGTTERMSKLSIKKTRQQGILD